MKQLLQKSMSNHDDLVVAFQYLDSKGNKTHRVASPIRFLGKDRFLALCLCREAPRQFYLDRCEKMALRSANEFVMPLAVTDVEAQCVV